MENIRTFTIDEEIVNRYTKDRSTAKEVTQFILDNYGFDYYDGRTIFTIQVVDKNIVEIAVLND